MSNFNSVLCKIKKFECLHKLSNQYEYVITTCKEQRRFTVFVIEVSVFTMVEKCGHTKRMFCHKNYTPVVHFLLKQFSNGQNQPRYSMNFCVTFTDYGLVWLFDLNIGCNKHFHVKGFCQYCRSFYFGVRAGRWAIIGWAFEVLLIFPNVLRS